VARRFYGDTISLEVLLSDEQFLTFRCGGDSRLVVTKSITGTADQETKACWRVDDLADEVAELRARGVQIKEFPELGTMDGVADIGVRAGVLVHRPARQLDRPAPAQVAASGDTPPPRTTPCGRSSPAPDRRPYATPQGEHVVTRKRVFILNSVIAGGYGVVRLVAASPILDLYGISPSPEGAYVARWFGVELFAIGLVTWLVRAATESGGGLAIARALAVTYGIRGGPGAVGDAIRALQRAGLDRGGTEPAAGIGLRQCPAQHAEHLLGAATLSRSSSPARIGE